MAAFLLMPDGRRTPGVYTEFNTVISNRGLVAQEVTVLFIGQMTSAGSAAAGAIEAGIESAADAWTRFGRRSHLAFLIGAAFKSNPGLRASAIGIEDSGSGVAWQYEYTFSGTASADGEVTIEGTGGLNITITVETGDTAADVAGAAAAAITAAAYPGLPFTVAVDGSVAAQLNFTAANAGTVGNSLAVAVEVDAAGLGGSDSTTSGSTDPVLQTAALDGIVTEDFDFICVALSDTTNLGALRDHLDALTNPITSLGSIGVFPAPGNLAAGTTLTANFATSGKMLGVSFPRSPSWEPEIAGCMVGILSSQSDPALPYNNRQMTGLINPEAQDKLSATEVETALQGGLCPIVVGAGNVPRVVRAISTYTQAPSGAADDALLDITVMRSLFWLRRQLNTMLQVKYPQAKNTAARRAAMRGDILAILFAAEELEIIADVEANAAGVTVETNGLDPSRVDVVVPAAVVRGLHIIAERIDLTLPA